MSLPPAWAWSTLGEVSEKPQYGWTTKANHDGTSVRLLRTTDITSGSIDWSHVPACTEEPADLTKYLLANDDIVVSRAGSVGASIRVIAPPPAVFASYLIRLRAVGIEPAYMSWFLRSPLYWTQIRDAAAGIALLNVNAKKLAAISMPLAPLNEQRRIVAAIEEQLSRLDAADASLAQARRRLDVMQSAILIAGAKGHRLVELGAVTTAHRYGTSIKCLADGAGPPVLRIPNIRKGRVDTSDLKFATSTEIGDCEVESGDLLFVRTNGSRDLIGRVASVDQAGMAFASYLIRARPDPAVLNPRWAVIALSTEPMRAVIESRAASTAGQYNLNLKSLKSLEIPLPPLDEQQRLVAEVEERLSVIDAMRASIERAQRRSAALRRSILERAFRGKLVPQDPSDEPASVLLDRIRTERVAAATTSLRSRRRF